MSKISWPNAASRCPTKRSGCGASRSVQHTLAGSSVDRAGWATSGTWTRSSSPSRDSGAISGRWCADAGRPTRFTPSSPSPTDAVRDGSAKLGHPVQNVTREHGLTPLPRCTACPKTVADDRRVPEERILHARLLMVTRRLLPPSPSERLQPVWCEKAAEARSVLVESPK